MNMYIQTMLLPDVTLGIRCCTISNILTDHHRDILRKHNKNTMNANIYTSIRHRTDACNMQVYEQYYCNTKEHGKISRSRMSYYHSVKKERSSHDETQYKYVTD